MAEMTYRPVNEDEYPAFVTALIEGFADDLPDEGLIDLIRSTLPPERTIGAFDGGEIVGTFGGYALDVTVPGGCLAMEGTTVVTVLPTHRRMGLMAEMMRRHLDSAVANGYAIAGLWASESSIYGRFGYGIASYADSVTMVARDVVFRPEVEIERVRRVTVEDAAQVLPPIFEQVLSKRPGMFARSPAWWRAEVLHDADWMKRGRTSKRIVVHDGPDGPDGYAIYRQKSDESDDGHANGSVHVVEVIAATDLAHASIWSYLTSVDGCPNVKWWNQSVGDPLAAKIAEPRRIMLKTRYDALWILILDVIVALEARSYESDGSVRFEVTNAFRNDVKGTYELTVTDGVGSCSRVEGDADLSVDLDVLGALYLGGGDAYAYRAANRVRGSMDAVGRIHELFRTAQAPWCNQVF